MIFSFMICTLDQPVILSTFFGGGVFVPVITDQLPQAQTAVTFDYTRRHVMFGSVNQLFSDVSTEFSHRSSVLCSLTVYTLQTGSLSWSHPAILNTLLLLGDINRDKSANTSEMEKEKDKNRKEMQTHISSPTHTPTCHTLPRITLQRNENWDRKCQEQLVGATFTR